MISASGYEYPLGFDVQKVRTYAVDFETTYATGRDIKSLGVVPYVEHPDTDAYLVAIHGEDVSYAGPLETAPWHLIDGHHWVSHNAAFDAAVYMEACKRGKIPRMPEPTGVEHAGMQETMPGEFPAPVEWDCTANLCVFLAAPRSLDKSVAVLMGAHMSKAVRDEMKGKRWETMSPEFQQACIAYAKIDAEKCYQLWANFHDLWPAEEIALSRHTMQMCLNGIAVDMPRVLESIAVLEHALWRCEQLIPWASELDAKGKEIPIMSPKALKAACVAANIPPPITTADKSEIFEAWLEKYGEAAPFVTAVKNYRRLNRTLEVLKKFRDQTRADGRLRYSLKYGGAHTLRWSGDAGLNFQNFTKEPLYFDEHYNVLVPKKLSKETLKQLTRYTVDMRGCLVPGPGKKFIVADLSQIEARVALWFADDQKQLQLIRDGLDLYEAHARSQMGYKFAQALKDYCEAPDTPEKDRNIRQFAKCRVLGLGFGLGFKKFVLIVMQWAGIKITEAEAKKIVDDYRRANPGIVALWNKLDRAMRGHVLKGDKEPFRIELPSWRVLEYFDVTGGDELKARDERGGHHLYWYGGKLFENLVQATARDILGAAILRIEAAGHRVVLHVHDEVVCEVEPDVTVEEIKALMTEVPHWAEGLPIGCSAKKVDRYFK